MIKLFLQLSSLLSDFITEVVGSIPVAGLEEQPGGLQPDGLAEDGLGRVIEVVEQTGSQAPVLAEVEDLQAGTPVLHTRQQQGSLFNTTL